MQEKKPRRGIQSVEIAFRILSVLQSSQQAMALKDIAPLAGLTASAANNYLVSLVRIGLAAADEKPGYYRLGPAALSLGVSAIQQIDGFEIVRREVTTFARHDEAKCCRHHMDRRRPDQPVQAGRRSARRL